MRKWFIFVLILLVIVCSFFQDDDFKPMGRMPPPPPPPPQGGGYGAYNAYISAATRYAALGAPTLYDHPGPIYGSKHQAPVFN